MFVLFLKYVIWFVFCCCVFVFLSLCDLNYVHDVMFILCFLCCACLCLDFLYYVLYFNLFCCFLFVVMLCLYFAKSFYCCFCVVVFNYLILLWLLYFRCLFFVCWYFNSWSFWFDQITTESNTAKCLCNRSVHTERWQIESNHIKVVTWHKCLTQALHSPDESHDIWETMMYTTTYSFLFRSVIPPKLVATSASPTNTNNKMKSNNSWMSNTKTWRRYN